jgi:integrase
VEEECRPATIDFYSDFLRPVVAAFGETVFDEIKAPDLEKAINASTSGKTARTAIARSSRALWRWAMRQREPLAAIDATIGLKFIHKKKDGHEPEVLTVDQCEKILKGSGRYQSALALMLYAGIRPEEMWGPDKPPLTWGHVSIAEEKITVPPECSKTRSRRVLQKLPPAIWQWLTPRGNKDPISFTRTRAVISHAKALAGYAMTDKWPQDSTRHTFASYMLAATDDPGRVAMWLGHEESPKMLFAHYYRPGLKAEAEKFLALCNVGASCPAPLLKSL